MKAILVVDMPDSCFHCPLEQYSNQCGANRKNTAGNANKRPSWCPLKPMPQKESEKHREEIEDWTGLVYSQGWNDCIEELEK